MRGVLQPWQLMVVGLAGWLNGRQQQQIEFLKTQVAVLKECQRGRILLNDDQRRRLARQGKTLGYRLLSEVSCLFTPDTILRWHRELVARKFDYSGRRASKQGRPRIREEIVELTIRLARENRSWGYRRIRDVLAELGYPICASTVANILKQRGFEPAPERQSTGSWHTFLKAHWDTLAAIDFTTIEVWTPGGLVTFYLLFVIELRSRRVHFAGCTPQPNEQWVKLAGRELTNWQDGFLLGKTHLTIDRDTKFTRAFRDELAAEGVRPVLTAPRTPNMNAHVERFFRSLKSECLNRLIFFGENSLRRAVKQYLEHYHRERPHQGLEGHLVVPPGKPPDISQPIRRQERLGGLLKSYRRAA